MTAVIVRQSFTRRFRVSFAGSQNGVRVLRFLCAVDRRVMANGGYRKFVFRFSGYQQYGSLHLEVYHHHVVKVPKYEWSRGVTECHLPAANLVTHLLGPSVWILDVRT